MDIAMFALFCLTLVRFVGVMISIDFFFRLRERIYLWIAIGWLIYAFSPMFGLLSEINPSPVYDFLYMSLALQGVLMLTSGAIWIFKKIRLDWVAMGGVLSFLIMVFLFMGGRRSIYGYLVPGLQLLILATVSGLSMVQHKAFTRVGGNSLYWLLSIFMVGAFQAGLYILIPPDKLPSIIYALTIVMSVLIIIFFLHLQHNISLHHQQESEARYRLIVENQSELLIKLTMEGRFLYANPNYCELFGLAQENIIGSPVLHQVSGLEQPGQAYFVARQSLFQPPYSCYVEELTLTAHGWRWLAWSGKTVLDADKHMVAIVSVGRDITKQKEAEAEILRLNQDLEQRVIERTAQLENLNKELEIFTYSVSHDLKAPLRGIEGFSQILQEDYADKLDEKGLRVLENIIASTGHMRALIDDLLAYARLERHTLQKQEIRVEDLVHEILVQHRLELEQSGAMVDVHLENARVTVDRENLFQALGNLIDNAVKYSRHATPPRIEVGCESQPEFLRIWIRDNGIGFDMAYKQKIFEIFQRLHGQGQYPGTGIGLAIVSKAVQRMGGQVWAESQPGQGAVFTIVVPTL